MKITMDIMVEKKLRIKGLKKEKRGYLNILYAQDDGDNAANDIDRNTIWDACQSVERKIEELQQSV